MLKRDVTGNGLKLTNQDVIFNSLSLLLPPPPLSDLLSAPYSAFTVPDMSSQVTTPITLHAGMLPLTNQGGL